jgi:hypothetical protein
MGLNEALPTGATVLWDAAVRGGKGAPRKLTAAPMHPETRLSIYERQNGTSKKITARQHRRWWHKQRRFDYTPEVRAAS